MSACRRRSPWARANSRSSCGTPGVARHYVQEGGGRSMGLPPRHPLHLCRRPARRRHRPADRAPGSARPDHPLAPGGDPRLRHFPGRRSASAISRRVCRPDRHSMPPPDLAWGFYDGFFGLRRAGSLWTVSLILLLGQNCHQGNRLLPKVMNPSATATAPACSACSRATGCYRAGLSMAAGQNRRRPAWAPAWLVKRRFASVRPVFLTIVALTLAHLLGVGAR